jgi:hypothetical protein
MRFFWHFPRSFSVYGDKWNVELSSLFVFSVYIHIFFDYKGTKKVYTHFCRVVHCSYWCSQHKKRDPDGVAFYSFILLSYDLGYS